jgi:hypothetical protein
MRDTPAGIDASLIHIRVLAELIVDRSVVALAGSSSIQYGRFLPAVSLNLISLPSETILPALISDAVLTVKRT